MNDKPTILLLHPSWVREAAYPLTLAGAIPALQLAGFRCVGFDADFDPFGPLLARIAAGDFQAVVASVYWFQLPELASRFKRIKAIAPNLPLIVVGPFPTMDPLSALKRSGAHWAVRGDADLRLAEVVTAAVNLSPPSESVAVYENGELIQSGRVHIERDLDALPFADRDVFGVEPYGYGYRSVRYPLAPMWSSRGCICDCAHCNVPETRPGGFRGRSAGSIADEMDRLIRDYAVADIHFEDDCFLASAPRVSAICEELIARGGDYTWELVNGVRPEHVDTSKLPLMRAAGCQRIALGIERVMEEPPASESALIQPANRIRAITETAKRVGISTTGYFILGYPGASQADDTRMVRLSQRLGLDMVHYSAYHTQPGSRFDITGIASGRDPQEIETLLHKAYRRFYLKPRQVAWIGTELLRTPRLLPAMVSKGLLELIGIDPDLL